MNTANHIVRYLAAAIIVALIGGLIGWYVFVHRQVAATDATDAARGFGQTSSFGASNGSTFQNTAAGFQSSSSTVATGATGTQAPRLWQVTSSPVAGMGFIASTTRLNFVERATGNVLEADASQTKVTRLTNTLFAKIYEARFTQSGQVLLRAVTEGGAVTTFLGTMATSSSDQINVPVALTGIYLAQNIRTVAVRDSSAQLFFISPLSGGASGITTDWKGVVQKKIFSSALVGWQARWLNDGKIYLVQNATDNVNGSAFQLGATGTLTPLLTTLPGLTVLPRSGSSALLYSTSDNGTLTLFAKASASENAVALPIHTVADKCVWSPWTELVAYCAVPASVGTNTFLQDWYAGAVHTQDSWWKVDVTAGTAEQLYATDPKYALDVQDPVIDLGGAYIAFINNLDRSLWMLKIDK
ncbi:MAG: hypothetical protein JWM46_504 [Candidatus Kaiserbacteria bacterium]|nr:hypothetical protein [Candidatus Kaiserbacteria bacterium]